MGEIEMVAEALPLEPASGTVRRLIEDKYLEENVLVYRAAYILDPLVGTKRKMVQVTCTACGETFYMDYAPPRGKTGRFGFIADDGVVYDGAPCRCPQCGAHAYALHISRIGAWRTIDYIWFTTAEIAAGHLVFALWECEKRVTKDGNITYGTNRIEAQTFAGGKAYRLMGRVRNLGGYIYYDGWHIAKKFSMVCDFENSAAVLYLTDELVDASCEEKSACACFAQSGAEGALSLLGEYMRLWQKFPCVENLVRQGYSEYVAGLIRHIEKRGDVYYATSKSFDARKASKYIDRHKSKPHEILGLDKAEFNAMKGMDFEHIQIYSTVKKIYGVRLTPQQLHSALRAGAALADILENGTCFSRKIQPVRLINYLERAQIRAGYLYDYWNMANDVYGELPESMMYPKNITRAHDRVLKEKKEKENAVLSEKIKKRARYAAALVFTDKDTGLMIRPAVSHAELIREGKVLDHCVATYARQVADGSTLILFVRRINDPDTPFFTLEYKNGAVVQNRGFKNCARTPEVEKFEEKWLEHIKKGAKKHGRKNDVRIA